MFWNTFSALGSYFSYVFLFSYNFFLLFWFFWAWLSFFGILKDGLVKCSYYYMNFHLFNMNRCILCSFCCFDCFCPTWCDNCNINCQVNTTSVQCPLHHCMSHKCIKQHPNMLWPVIQHEQLDEPWMESAFFCTASQCSWQLSNVCFLTSVDWSSMWRSHMWYQIALQCTNYCHVHN